MPQSSDGHLERLALHAIYPIGFHSLSSSQSIGLNTSEEARRAQRLAFLRTRLESVGRGWLVMVGNRAVTLFLRASSSRSLEYMQSQHPRLAVMDWQRYAKLLRRILLSALREAP